MEPTVALETLMQFHLPTWKNNSWETVINLLSDRNITITNIQPGSEIASLESNEPLLTLRDNSNITPVYYLTGAGNLIFQLEQHQDQTNQSMFQWVSEQLYNKINEPLQLKNINMESKITVADLKHFTLPTNNEFHTWESFYNDLQAEKFNIVDVQ